MKEPISPVLHGGFTLVEILVSMAILVLLLLMMVSMTDATRRTWSFTSTKVEEFRDAREAFESMTRKLSQATLNTFWDYDNPNAPTKYLRQSELRFWSGQGAILLAGAKDENGNTLQTATHAIFFQAPLGYVDNTTNYGNLTNLLNTWGYFIEFGSDTKSRPGFISTMSNPPPLRYRFRLMEMMEPSDSLSIYKYTSGIGKYLANTSNNSLYLSSNPPGGYTGREWFTDPLALAPQPVHALGENIVALVLLPKLSLQDEQNLQDTNAIPSAPLGTSLCPDYSYDSTSINTQYAALNKHNQLPPVVQVTMVAVDETSYNRFQSLQANNNFPANLVPASLFQQAGDLTNSSSAGYAKDLQTLQGNLQANHLNYRVFTSDVSLKAAKWSRMQTN